MKRPVLTVFVAALVVLAGCSGGTSGGPSADGGDAGDGATTTSDGDTGTVRFYVSDQQMAIDDFRHLNVTIESITFQYAGDETADDDADENETETPENETETPEPTATPTAENESEDDGGPPEDAPEGDDADEQDEEDDDDEAEDDDGVADEESGSRIQADVDSRTVDLTELKGENATLMGEYDLPAGKYTKVFLHVGETEGVLKDGTAVNVKLPSQKLHLNKGFTLEPNTTVSFVYDVSVVKAGNSGKYILKPVIGESGPDQEFRDVDEEDEADEEEAEEADDAEDDDEDEATEADDEAETNDTSTGDTATPTAAD